MRGFAGGRGPAVLLLHGSGPGAGSVGNWRTVLDALAARLRVLAVDLVGFGGSDRPTAPPYFDMARWRRQARAALDWLGAEEVGVIGHSLGASLALDLAAHDPRVSAVLTTGAMGAPMRANAHLHQVWRCPRSREAMAQAARTLVFDPGLITEAYLDARMAVIGAPGYADYFDTMFAGEFEPYIAAAIVPPEDLTRITVPVTMLHGRDDAAFPAEETSQALLGRLPGADLTLLARCAHSVALERPDAFLAAAATAFS